MLAYVRTLSPLPEQRVLIDRSPFWIGSGARCALRLWHPSVQEQHVAVLEEADGRYLIPGAGRTLVNGAPLIDDWRLESSVRVELSPGVSVVIELEASAAPSGTVAPPILRPPPPPPPKRRRRDWRPHWQVPWRALLVGSVVLSLVGGGGYLLWRASHVRPDGTLTEEEQLTVDSLLSISYEHIERGYMLRRIGETAMSRGEFDAALAVIQRHPLSRRDDVKDRLYALARVIDALDPERQLAGRLRRPRPRSLAEVGLGATLTRAQFTEAWEQVQQEFQTAFPGRALTVTGTDHAEHLQLYGPGGALDVRTRDLTDEQIAFVVDACRRAGIRVKDFSREAVMRSQAERARALGRADLASTGVHLHIDRFGLRRDRWTVGTGAP
jgi:hypothetical protein